MYFVVYMTDGDAESEIGIIVADSPEDAAKKIGYKITGLVDEKIGYFELNGRDKLHLSRLPEIRSRAEYRRLWRAIHDEAYMDEGDADYQ